MRDPVSCAEFVSERVREAEGAVHVHKARDQPGLERLVRRGTDLYFSSLSGQRLIQDAIWSFWRASMSVGSALDFGRYVNRSASAA